MNSVLRHNKWYNIQKDIESGKNEVLYFFGRFRTIASKLPPKVDSLNKIVWVTDRKGELHKINFESITGVEFAE